jgi:hypothetical protein
MPHSISIKSAGLSRAFFLQFAMMFFVVFGLGGKAYSQAGSAQPSVLIHDARLEDDKDLIKASQNPVGGMISFPIVNTMNFNIGTYNRNQNVLALQPVIPTNLNSNWMLITRIIQPFTSQPYPDQNSGGQFGIGDMTPSFFLAPQNPGSVIWGVGPSMVIPTATSKILGQGKFSLGPSVVVLAQPGQWTVGGLVSNVWSVAGSGGRPAVNRMTLQYFLVYNLKQDWYVSAAPVMIADWRAQAGSSWLVPVGGGVGKMVILGSRPVDFAATFYGNAVAPTGLPNWQMSLQMTLLFPTSK